jgi:type VI protein secretion system component Hcp
MDSTTKIYLDIDFSDGESDIGESLAGGYKQRIDIESFQFNVEAKQNVKDTDNKNVSGNLHFDVFTFTKVFDSSSLKLTNALGRHTRFDEVLVAVDQQLIDRSIGGPERNEILFIKLKSGYIADIKLQTSDGGKSAAIKETITLSFQNCDITYFAYAGNLYGGEELGDDYRMDTHIFRSSNKEQGQ